MNGDMLGWLENFVELFVSKVDYKGASVNVKDFTSPGNSFQCPE